MCSSDLQVLRLVRRLNEEFNKTVVMVLHDINQAMFYSDELIALSNGSVAAQGSPCDVVDSKLLEKVYGINLDVVQTPTGPFVLPV